MVTLKRAIPVLHVANSAAAVEFYCGALGFREAFAYRPTTAADPCYMGLSRDSAELHLSSFSGDGVPGGLVYLLVDDVDGFHEELRQVGVHIDMAPTDQSWGNREMYLRDADGNRIAFVQPGPADAGTNEG
jgi:uncharacterized glyoxalase superfamily protein PhnB